MPERVAVGSGVAVTAHHVATQCALEILQSGGNAIDAAVAANAVLGVVAPETCGIGGDLFALVHEPGSAIPAALNASGRAGSGAVASAIRLGGIDELPMRSHHTVTVPGCIDGWEALLDRYGTTTLGQALEPSLDLATHGFVVSPELAGALARMAPTMSTQASAPDLYPQGSAPAAGTVIARPLLAATLESVAARGREAFYCSAVGAEISRVTEGVITSNDLEANRADWIDALGLSVGERTGWTIPPNSQGYLALGAWWIFNALEPPRDASDPHFHHAAIEAYRAIAWDRDRLVADAEHAPLPPQELLAPARLAERAAAIRPDRPTTWPDPGPTDSGTTYLTVLDGGGLGISLIQSNFHGVGTGLSAGGTGVWLHNRGAGFNLIEGHPNELGPGKRPMHTLSPTSWTRGGRLELLLGTRGGHQQPQLLLQTLAALFHANLTPAETQQLPRWTTSEWMPAARSRILVEDGFDAAPALSAMGHDIDPEPKGRQGGWGPVSMIQVADDGIATGAADPRVSTSSAGSRNST